MGTFVAVTKVIATICRKNGGNIRIKAFSGVGGPTVKVDLRECDQVYVEAPTRAIADKVWLSLGSALVDANHMYKKVVDVAGIVRGSEIPVGNALSEFIGIGGQNIRRLTSSETAYSRISCPNKGDCEFVQGEDLVVDIVVESRNEGSLARLVDQVKKRFNQIVWGNPYGKVRGVGDKPAKESVAKFQLADSDWSDSDSDGGGECVGDDSEESDAEQKEDLMCTVGVSVIDTLKANKKAFNQTRGGIAKRKGVDFWDVTPDETLSEMSTSTDGSGDVCVVSHDSHDSDWKEYYDGLGPANGVGGVGPKTGSWSKPLEVVVPVGKWVPPSIQRRIDEEASGEECVVNRNISLSVVSGEGYDSAKGWGDQE